jgi:hypothetical protein
MWNNITHGNTNMNRFERLMEHKGHLERLAQIKKVINTKNPKTPSFISKRMINPGSRLERALKIHYENQNLFNRMYEIRTKNSPYSACMNIPSKCPAYELLGYHRSRKKNIIKNENNKLYKRFTLARPTYNLGKLAKDYEYSKYLEKIISQNNNRGNPNLDFVSFGKFNQKIRSYSFYRSINNKLKCDIDLNNKERPRSSYSSKRIFKPNLTVNQNNAKDEWFAKTDYSNNNSNNNNNLFEKPKLQRPHSCKPKIVINREIQNNSDIINSDQVFNNSHKIHRNYRNKPSSGKTRTNGSYSTNVMTSP